MGITTTILTIVLLVITAIVLIVKSIDGLYMWEGYLTKKQIKIKCVLIVIGVVLLYISALIVDDFIKK